MISLHEGDCLDVMKTLSDQSIDSVVTDPPYGISFLGRKWDYDVPSVDIWQEVLRVLKPGGHLLSFSGTRTYHRMVVAIEDAGFEIRDQIGWLYGAGMPKSLDVSKAIDKAAGIAREDKFEGGFDRRVAGPSGNKKCETCGKWLVSGSPCRCPRPQDAAVSDAAAVWQGWGTALKPAWEPIVLARKPPIGAIATNVLQYGTGGLNIDACRITTSENLNGGAYAKNGTDRESYADWRFKRTGRHSLAGDDRIGAAQGMFQEGKTAQTDYVQPTGRWPANTIHDGSDEVLDAFAAFGERKTTWISPTHANNRGGDFLGALGHPGNQGFNDSGTAARFFYSAKASKSDRAGSTHPTVKPVNLMRYLCRLITPPNGIVLDPFAGTGTTGQAAVEEGFGAILIEREATYCDDIRRRLSLYLGGSDLIRFG